MGIDSRPRGAVSRREARRTGGCARRSEEPCWGDTVRQWRKDGMAIDDTGLCDLGARDGEALCELDGVRLRFTAETVERRARLNDGPQGSTVVLTLRQIDGPADAEPIHLVAYTDAPLSGAACEGRRCGQLDDARAIAERTARRYVCTELFRRAADIIAGDQAA